MQKLLIISKNINNNSKVHAMFNCHSITGSVIIISDNIIMTYLLFYT